MTLQKSIFSAKSILTYTHAYALFTKHKIRGLEVSYCPKPWVYIISITML